MQQPSAAASKFFDEELAKQGYTREFFAPWWYYIALDQAEKRAEQAEAELHKREPQLSLPLLTLTRGER